MMPRIEIDPGAGFCFGVKEVVRSAEAALARGEKLYGLGEMVHNGQEVDRLEGLGLITIDHAGLAQLHGQKVLFRAHGEPPQTYKIAAERQLEVMDGTCPIVLKLQERIRKAYRRMDREKEQLVIFGKSRHPETIGLLGQVGGDAVVISSPGELDRVDKSKKVILFSQTTMDPEQYSAVEKILEPLLARTDDGKPRSHCGICGQMKNRKPGLRSFAREHGVVVFVSGRNSSNGRLLYEFCRGINPQTYWVSHAAELEPSWFDGAENVGVSGATSTSMEQLEEIRDRISNLISS